LRSYHAGGIRLETKIDDVELDIDTAIPCGLIVNELVSNALKHAFPGGREKGAAPGASILVTLHANLAGETQLSVCDNGIGFPAELNFRETESLGLQLVTTLAGQIGGTVNLATNANDASGTKWIVMLPSDSVKALETLSAEKRPGNTACGPGEQGNHN
jgi:two-component sensor histidine kinase